jgi:hypothetical protein
MSALLPVFRHIQARFLEFRLFFDEPALIWKAQTALIRANLRFCFLLLRPVLILALPITWLMLQMGAMPLRVGEAAVVTAKSRADLALIAPPGIVVETEPIHFQGLQYWRIRPVRAVSGVLRFSANGVTLTKSIVAGDRPTFLLSRREHCFFGNAPGVQWLEIDYPEASRWWIVWFLAASTAGAWPFVKRV